MRKGGLPAIAVAGMVLALAGGCASPRAADGPGPSRASRIAADLGAAEAALAARDARAIADSLERLRGRVHPVDPAAPDLVAELAAVAGAASPPLRGRALGPGYVRGTLDPGADVSLHQLFLSGQAATIAAESTPRDDMRMRIRDAGGAVVCERDPAHADECRFTPLYTQRYRIELSNEGSTSARYYLVVD